VKTTLRLLLPVCLLLSGIFSTTIAFAAPAEPPAGTGAKPVLGTVTWTGAVNADWHNPGNWSPAALPLSGSLVGDDVVIPPVGNGNYPVVTAAAAARSISIAAGAFLTIYAGGSLNVIASATDGISNSGTLLNAGTLLVDSSFRDGIVNLFQAALSNSGTLTIRNGTGNRLENYGFVYNTGGTFTVDGGLDIGLINHQGATINNSGGTFTVKNGTATRVENYSTIINSATFEIMGGSAGSGLLNKPGGKVLSNTGNFTISNGLDTQVENDGKIENGGTFTIVGTTAAETLINRDTVINNGTFTIRNSDGRLLKNSRYVKNSGSMTIRLSHTQPVHTEQILNEQTGVIFNAVGASLFMGGTTASRIMTNHGQFLNNGRAEMTNVAGMGLYNSGTGIVDVQDSLGINSLTTQAIITENWFALGANGKLDIGGNIGGGGIHNKAIFISNAGCRLTAGSMANSAITNDAGAVFTNNCATTFGGSGTHKIANNGRYTHLNGSMTLGPFGHTSILNNNSYAELNIPFSFSGNVANYFYNTDTLILGDQCIFPFKTNVSQVFGNAAGAYLYSDAEFEFREMGTFLSNNGKAILGPSSKYVGSNLASSNVIYNTDTLYLQGEIQITKFGGHAIGNTGYVHHSGSLTSTNTYRGILNNGGTFVNSGSLQLDSITNNALLLQGAQTFTNTPSGSISMTYVYGDGIRNEAGSLLNEGEIHIGTKDTMGLSGIFNQAMFTNTNLIEIGAGGVEFGLHGIQNTFGGNFLNRGTVNIGVGSSAFLGDGIRNEQNFTNDYCAEINLHENLHNSGTFDNNGLFTINTNQAHTNTGIFTNRGTVTFVQPGSIPGQINAPFVLSCPDDLAICQYAAPLNLTTLGANPGGGVYSGASVSGNMFNPTTAGPGTHTITYAYTHYDDCAATCTFDIEVVAAPVATATPSPEAICSGDETDIALSSTVPGTTFTWIVQSASGNVSGQSGGNGSTIAQTINVNDSNPGTVVYRITPTGPAPHYCVGQTTDVTVNLTANPITSITCPNPATVACLSSVPAPNPAAVSATDICGKPIDKEHLFTSLPYDVECINRFKLTRWYQVTSSAGNTASCSQVITVYDNAQPNFTFVPANVTVQCNSVPAVGTPIAADGCGGAVNIAYNGQAIATGACTDAYTITRQWTATDACGNTRTATQRIAVVDTQKPGFSSTPANVTVQCDAIPAVATPVATDNCDATVAITYNGQTKTNGACVNAYTLTRRWTAADNCGNTLSISQRITVVDNGKPTFTSFPANTTISCTDPIPSVGAATATDGCGAATVTYLGQSTVSGSCPTSYQIRRTWRATDACGNSTVNTQTIQVTDTGAPVFTSTPGPLTIECNMPLPPLVNPTASDACGGYAQITFLGNVPSGSGCAQDYTVTRTWRAEDLCGNSTTTSQVITVLGNNYGGEEGAESRKETTTKLIAHRSSLLVNPNPTTDRIRLDLTDFAGEAITVSIFGDLGQLVWENRIPSVEDLQLQISLREAGAAAGIYTVSLRSASGIVAKRVVLME